MTKARRGKVGGEVNEGFLAEKVGGFCRLCDICEVWKGGLLILCDIEGSSQLA